MGHANHSSKGDCPSGLGESKSDKELSSKTIKQLNLPTDIRWFSSKNALFAAHGGTVNHPIAFDYRMKSGECAKIFGRVSEPGQYLTVIQSLSPQYRCGYEVIQPHVPAKLYIDIESKLPFECTGHEDPTVIGERFQTFHDAALKELAEYLKPLPQLILDIVGTEARIIVLDSCRLMESNKTFKMSFHVIVQNIMFQNNNTDSGKKQNQQRQAVMLALLRELPETAHIAPDPKAYSSFQNFRLPHCFKMGQPEGWLKLQPELCSPGMSEQEMLLGSLITHVASDALIIKNISLYPKLAELCPQLPLKPLVAARGAKRQRVVEGASPAHHNQLLGGLKRLLVMIGDTSSAPMCIEAADEEAQGKLKVVCRNNGSRKCPFLPRGETRLHNSNNATLYLMPTDKDYNYEVRYSCHSARCKSGGGQIVGTISRQPSGAWSGVSYVNTIGSIFKRQMLDKPQEAGSAPGNGMDLEASGVHDSNRAQDPKVGEEGDKQMQDMCEDHDGNSQDHPMTDAALDDVKEYDTDYQMRCFRELLLMGPLPWDSQETETLFAAYKAVCPSDIGGALREWSTRIPILHEAEILNRLLKVAGLKHMGSEDDPLRVLHRLRLAHPVFLLRECSNQNVQKPPTIEASALLGSIRGDSCNWQTFTRVTRQLCPTDRDQVICFVERMYNVKSDDVRTLWDYGQSFVSDDLAQYVRMRMCSYKLISEVIPEHFGLQAWSYVVNDDATELTVHLDSGCTKTQTVSLLLESGEFIGKGICIKPPASLFEFTNADKALADLLLKPCDGTLKGSIADTLRFDEEEKKYRQYQPINGQWKVIPDNGAVKIVTNAIQNLLMPMMHLQQFREDINPSVNRTKTLSEKVNEMINTYAQKLRNAKDVLSMIQTDISCPFRTDRYPSMLCFANGLVDLTTGKLLGPAAPDLEITQCVPHMYYESADTTAMAALIQTFWPKVCCGDESRKLLDFYQQWKGYCLTGELNLQKSLWMTGHGSNGKSVLATLDDTAWGEQLVGTMSMSTFQQTGSSNNDSLFQARKSRALTIVENADDRKVNEEMFKKITGGDKVSVQAKYIANTNCRFRCKLTFMQNDTPVWSSPDACAIRRRIWNLPMQAQFLSPGDQQRRKLALEGKSKCVFDLDNNFLKKLTEERIQEYIRWCVEGAVQYYENGMNIVPPKTILEASEREGHNKVELFKTFIETALIAAERESKISTAEIREVFLAIEGFSIDTKTEDQFNKELKKMLTDKDNEKFEAVRAVRIMFPTRLGNVKSMGYSGLAWEPGDIEAIVKSIRDDYQV